MSTRGNIVVHSTDGVDHALVFLYQHCDGYDLGVLLKEVLARKARWDDPEYLARMIFSRMVKDRIDDENGFGISAHPMDANCNVLVVTPGDAPTVALYPVGAYESLADICSGKDKTKPIKRWTFDKYIAESDKTLTNLMTKYLHAQGGHMPAQMIPVGPFSVQFLQRARGQETPYFVAKVYRDGAEVGTAENDGRGGCSNIRGKGLAEALRAVVDQAAKDAGLDVAKALGDFEREDIAFHYAECVGYQRGAKDMPFTEYLRQYAAALGKV